MDTTLTTDRLTLRPLARDDAPVIQRECGNWNVARMTSRIPHPYPDGLAGDWIAEQGGKRAAGTAFNFGIVQGDTLIGVIGLEQREAGAFELGYWIAERWWGQGLATEAVTRMIAFAFDELGLDALVAGHFDDNPASGRVLAKCGFRYTGDGREWSKARDGEVSCRRFVLQRDVSAARRDQA